MDYDEDERPRRSALPFLCMMTLYFLLSLGRATPQMKRDDFSHEIYCRIEGYGRAQRRLRRWGRKGEQSALDNRHR